MTGVYEVEKPCFGIELRPEHRGIAILLIQHAIDFESCCFLIGRSKRALYQVYQRASACARSGDFANQESRGPSIRRRHIGEVAFNGARVVAGDGPLSGDRSL